MTQRNPSPQQPSIAPVLPWVLVALQEIGVKENLGDELNPRIQEYLCFIKRSAGKDEIMWNSAFVGWCLSQAGIVHSGCLMAQSWLTEPATPPIDSPRIGCLAVFWKGRVKGAQGHVGFWLGDDGEGRCYLLGANKENEVCIKLQYNDQILGYRWPTQPDSNRCCPAHNRES